MGRGTPDLIALKSVLSGKKKKRGKGRGASEEKRRSRWSGPGNAVSILVREGKGGGGHGLQKGPTHAPTVSLMTRNTKPDLEKGDGLKKTALSRIQLSQQQKRGKRGERRGK